MRKKFPLPFHPSSHLDFEINFQHLVLPKLFPAIFGTMSVCVLLLATFQKFHFFLNVANTAKSQDVQVSDYFFVVSKSSLDADTLFLQLKYY